MKCWIESLGVWLFLSALTLPNDLIRRPAGAFRSPFSVLCSPGRHKPPPVSSWKTSAEVLTEEGLNLVEGDNGKIVVKVSVDSAGDEEQLLVVALQTLEGVLAEVAGVGLVAMDDEDGVADFLNKSQDGLVEDGQDGGDVPALVGVQRAGMLTARGLVMGVVILHEPRRVLGTRVDHAAGTGGNPAGEVLGSLGAKGLAPGLAGRGAIGLGELPLCGPPAHVVPR